MNQEDRVRNAERVNQLRRSGMSTAEAVHQFIIEWLAAKDEQICTGAV